MSPRRPLISMRIAAILILATLLCGCAGPQSVIRIASPSHSATLKLVDERPYEETRDPGVVTCRNLGILWEGVNDKAFTNSRVELLRARLDSTFGQKIGELRVKHFQTCFLVRSKPAFAGVAGASVAAAIAMNSLVEKGGDIVFTHLDFSVDGKQFDLTDVRPFRQGFILKTSLDEPTTVAIVASATEEIIARAVEQVAAQFDSGSR
jgi:hypothetical protein